MAGDWIKMRSALHDEAEVRKMGRILNITDVFAITGRLLRVWSWADTQTADGRIKDAVLDDIDDIARTPGFADSMVAVGWLKVEKDSLVFPHFDRHNGESAKKRAQTSKRVVRHRNALSVTSALPEKRREEKITIEAVVVALAEAGIGEPTRSRLAALPGITIQRIHDTRDKYSGGLFVNAIMALCDKKPIRRTADTPDVSPRLAAQRAEDAKVMAERANQQEATT